MTVLMPEAPTTDAQPDLPVLRFVLPMPGFPGHERFVLVRHDDGAGLFQLRSLDDPELRFVAVAPAAFFPDYAPEIDEVTVDALGLRSEHDALLLLIVTIGADPSSATANLKAPVVINLRSRLAAQPVLADPELAIRRRVFPAAA